MKVHNHKKEGLEEVPTVSIGVQGMCRNIPRALKGCQSNLRIHHPSGQINVVHRPTTSTSSTGSECSINLYMLRWCCSVTKAPRGGECDWWCGYCLSSCANTRTEQCVDYTQGHSRACLSSGVAHPSASIVCLFLCLFVCVFSFVMFHLIFLGFLLWIWIL